MSTPSDPVPPEPAQTPALPPGRWPGGPIGPAPASGRRGPSASRPPEAQPLSSQGAEESGAGEPGAGEPGAEEPGAEESGAWQAVPREAGARQRTGAQEPVSGRTGEGRASSSGKGRGGRVICVTGARGGLGASTLLLHLAWALRREGRSVAIVDLDPVGGLGLLLGEEILPGLRWGDLPEHESAFRPGRLIGALPAWHAMPVLTGDARGGPPLPAGATGGSCGAVLEALAGEHDLVLVDLPRSLPAPSGSRALLLAGLDLRSAVACEALVPRLGVPVELVARKSGEDTTVADLELIAGCPVLGTLPTDRAVAQRIARGEDPVRARSAMRRAATVLARRLLDQEAAAQEAAAQGTPGADASADMSGQG